MRKHTCVCIQLCLSFHFISMANINKQSSLTLIHTIAGNACPIVVYGITFFLSIYLLLIIFQTFALHGVLLYSRVSFDSVVVDVFNDVYKK